MSKRRIKNTPRKCYIGQKGYADRLGGKDKDKNKSKQRWIWGEIDKLGNDLIYSIMRNKRKNWVTYCPSLMTILGVFKIVFMVKNHKNSLLPLMK